MAKITKDHVEKWSDLLKGKGMYQTRSEENGIKEHESIELAILYSKTDRTVWKISFNAFNGERIRLVRLTHPDAVHQYFVLEQLADAVMVCMHRCMQGKDCGGCGCQGCGYSKR